MMDGDEFELPDFDMPPADDVAASGPALDDFDAVELPEPPGMAPAVEAAADDFDDFLPNPPGMTPAETAPASDFDAVLLPDPPGMPTAGANDFDDFLPNPPGMAQPAATPAGDDFFDDFALPEPPVVAALGDGAFDQSDIDALFGFDASLSTSKKSGLKAVIESNIISHERLPMLEVVCDRMVRTFATSMRNLTSDAIDVSLEDIHSVRFGDFMNRLPVPAMISVFNVKEWENFGLVTVEPTLIYAVVDTLLGGRKANGPVRIEGRAFTTIETNLVARMVELALNDFADAFEPIAPVTMSLERMENSPRFAAIAGPSNIAAIATFRVDMDGRGGKFTILLPYATMEPVREKLLQRFMGEKLGRDRMWEAHMANEMRQTEVSLNVVLGEKAMRIEDITRFAVGQTIALGVSPDDPLALHCGGVTLGHAQIGQRCNNIAVRVMNDISKGLPK